MSEEAIFGQLISTWHIQQAALSTLREWLPSYLAAVERQEGLQDRRLGRPEGPISYYPGVDFFSAGPGESTAMSPPLVIVTVEPQGRPEMTADLYFQSYELRVACVVRGSTEEEALQLASLYGAASMLLAQIGGLQGLAERTVMTGAPTVELVDPEAADRRLMRSVVTYSVHVPHLIQQWGPKGETLAESPEVIAPEALPSEAPTVQSTLITINATEEP